MPRWVRSFGERGQISSLDWCSQCCYTHGIGTRRHQLAQLNTCCWLCAAARPAAQQHPSRRAEGAEPNLLHVGTALLPHQRGLAHVNPTAGNQRPGEATSPLMDSLRGFLRSEPHWSLSSRWATQRSWSQCLQPSGRSVPCWWTPPAPSAPRCHLLQLEVVGALLKLLVFGFHGFAQLLQNLGWKGERVSMERGQTAGWSPKGCPGPDCLNVEPT